MADGIDEGLAWQIGVWDRLARIYEQEIDTRFGPVIEGWLGRAVLKPGETVLDLGTGTGAVTIMASPGLGPDGRMIAMDISPEMLDRARVRIQAHSLRNVTLAEGGAEAIPVASESLDAVLASLSMMYVIERARAAQKITRVLRPGGRFVASVWAGPDEADIVLFQETTARSAPAPPVRGVGPGALADPAPFLSQLESAGLRAHCEQELTAFQFVNLHDARDALAGVTSAALTPEVEPQAKAAVQERMWPDHDSVRQFRNATLYIVAQKPA